MINKELFNFTKGRLLHQSESCAEELEDLEKRANEWIRSQGYNEENLPNDEYVQMKDAFIAGARDYRYRSIVCESTLHY